ncbi:hypothetical protein [Sessilibacter corallicola]|uniref:Uncharacterized protein n=1 Tax=Sessilibacter corallicola TaxID=2904075 RepID=A0ABQ0A7J2_9GAMM
MRTLNDIAQWVAIFFIIGLLFNFDLDSLKNSPQKISILESKITEQKNQINSLKQDIIDIRNELQSVATINDLKELKKSQLNNTSQEISATDIQTQTVTDVESKLDLVINYYSKNMPLVILCAVVLITIISFIILSGKNFREKSQNKTRVTKLTPVSIDKDKPRKCA